MDKSIKLSGEEFWYDSRNPLGRGGYATVYPADRKRDATTSTARHVLKIPHRYEEGAKLSWTLRELTVSRQLPSIPQLACTVNFGIDTDRLGIRISMVMPRLEVSMHQFVQRNKANDMTRRQLAPVALRDMAIGLYTMHSCGWIHRDLKPDNVYLNQNRVVLSDFGLCSMHWEPDVEPASPKEQPLAGSTAATPALPPLERKQSCPSPSTSPELIVKRPACTAGVISDQWYGMSTATLCMPGMRGFKSSYTTETVFNAPETFGDRSVRTTKTDIYLVACTVVFLLAGRTPSDTEHWLDLLIECESQMTAADARKWRVHHTLLHSMLHYNAHKRPSASAILGTLSVSTTKPVWVSSGLGLDLSLDCFRRDATLIRWMLHYFCSLNDQLNRASLIYMATQSVVLYECVKQLTSHTIELPHICILACNYLIQRLMSMEMPSLAEWLARLEQRFLESSESKDLVKALSFATFNLHITVILQTAHGRLLANSMPPSGKHSHVSEFVHGLIEEVGDEDESPSADHANSDTTPMEDVGDDGLDGRSSSTSSTES